MVPNEKRTTTSLDLTLCDLLHLKRADGGLRFADEVLE
jgi:hypothetical protein